MAVLRILLITAMLSVAPVAHADDDEGVWQENVRLTFYIDRGTMRWGNQTHLGAAACGSYFPPGSRLQFNDGWTVMCEDTGRLGKYQVDVWAPTYSWGISNIERAYGTYTWVTVKRWGWGEY